MTSRRRPRTISVQTASTYNSDINITPMVDVVLVLLIIFMVVTPLLEKDLDVKVPDVEQAVDPTTAVPDQLVVRVSAEGDVSVNDERVASTDAYVEALREALARRRPGDRLVFFTADHQARYVHLVTAIDGARRAGAEAFGVSTEDDDQR
jgi:biopolymer transport protein ExbD